MLEKLHLKNVGPAPEMELEFGSRVNIITGDNGLGKSFILDVAWFALTGDWLQNSNQTMLNGQEVRPSKKNTKLEFTLNSTVPMKAWEDITEASWSFVYNFSIQKWQDQKEIILSNANRKPDSLVIYVCPDSEFGIHDHTRDTFGFSAKAVWGGLTHSVLKGNGEFEIKKILCNGLIRDWSQWLLEKSDSLHQLEKALEVLSPNENEKLIVAKSTRVSIDDVRDIPTLKMPYGQEVPVTHASSGIKRIISIAYLLVWTWQEHLRAAELRQLEPSKKMVLLIDELECHLHPQWQRVILGSLLNVVKEIMQDDVQIQIIATTHSPLVMASLEPIFDPDQDAWFDLNLVDGKVELEKMHWSRRGGAEDWLISEAFDLRSTGSIPREQAIEEAAKVFHVEKPSKKKFLEADKKLRFVLSETDEFWIRWRFIGQKKGWL